MKSNDIPEVLVNGVKQDVTIDENGTLRFRENKILSKFSERSSYDMNQLWEDYFSNEILINDVVEYYKLIGYSVFGFWEVFGWDINVDGKGFEPLTIVVDGENYND